MNKKLKPLSTKATPIFQSHFTVLILKTKGLQWKFRNLPCTGCKGHSSHSISPQNSHEKATPTL